MRERVEDFRETLWVGILAVALLVLAAVSAESAAVTAFAPEKEQPIFVGEPQAGR